MSSPKLRPGGLLSGDDYLDLHDTPLLPFARWNATWRAWRRFDWEVISTMQRFCRQHCLSLHVTWLHDCYAYPAWWLVKPLRPVARGGARRAEPGGGGSGR